MTHVKLAEVLEAVADIIDAQDARIAEIDIKAQTEKVAALKGKLTGLLQEEEVPAEVVEKLASVPELSSFFTQVEIPTGGNTPSLGEAVTTPGATVFQETEKVAAAVASAEQALLDFCRSGAME